MTPEPQPYVVEAWQRGLSFIGGEGLVSEVCRPREVDYLIGTKHFPANTCACGAAARGIVPFEGDQGRGAIVCAVCDAATEFPRCRP
jgi:hypothetical protein